MTEAEKHAPHIVGTKFYTQAEVDAHVAQERAAIVEWLREKAAAWEEAKAQYQSSGNNGPCLGGPSFWGEASAIERLDHHKEDSKHG